MSLRDFFLLCREIPGSGIPQKNSLITKGIPGRRNSFGESLEEFTEVSLEEFLHKSPKECPVESSETVPLVAPEEFAVIFFRNSRRNYWKILQRSMCPTEKFPNPGGTPWNTPKEYPGNELILGRISQRTLRVITVKIIWKFIEGMPSEILRAISIAILKENPEEISSGISKVFF